MVKVLHVIIALHSDGAELMMQRLVESHHGSPDFCHVVCSLTTNGKIGEQLAGRGVDVHVLGMQTALGIPLTLVRLVRLIRTTQPDIIQTWMYHADFLAGLAGWLSAHRRIVWGIRTTDVRASGSHATAILRKVCARLSRSMPRAIVCAAHASLRAHVSVGYDERRMLVIPNGFDMAKLSATLAQRNALREQCGFAQNAVVIGIVGRFHPVKDHANFVRAAGLAAERNPDIRFLMVGRSLDADNRELAGWITATGHASRFVLLGERRDVPICLAAMDLFCLSSRTEGFPNVVGEAMAMGLPSVVTDVGDAAMLVARTGIVVPKENSEALADGLLRLAELSEDARRQLGAAAMERTHLDFTIERARQRFEQLYLRLLASD